jgi:regulator of sigma E protease
MLLMLGVLITVHELGHFLAARAFGIRVREFAIGMGPVIYKRQRDENAVKYTLRALPVGGFCDMTEDESSDEPSHFRNKPLWQRVVVLLAGSLMNLLLGLLLAFIFFLSYLGAYVRAPVVTELMDGFPYEGAILAGDRIVAVDGNPVHSYTELSFYLSRVASQPCDFTLLRGGQRVKALEIKRTLEDGALFGFIFGETEVIAFGGVVKLSWDSTWFYVRLVWLTIGDIISGRESAGNVMGPVGMGAVVNDTLRPQDAEGNAVPLSERVLTLVNMAALIAVNLAVVNMLPIPALDGGRILLALISAALLKIRKRPLSAKVEGALHGGMFVLLLGLMVAVFFNDIARIFRG